MKQSTVKLPPNCDTQQPPETCIKINPRKSERYSASPYGKRFDIYETSETEQPDESVQDDSVEHAALLEPLQQHKKTKHHSKSISTVFKETAQSLTFNEKYIRKHDVCDVDSLEDSLDNNDNQQQFNDSSLDKSGSPDELKKAFERNYSKTLKAKNKELN